MLTSVGGGGGVWMMRVGGGILRVTWQKLETP